MTTLALLALAVARPAAPVDPPIVAASLFKNGYAYVVRQTALPAGGELVLRMPETAVLGTFWIAGSPGVKIGEVTSTTVETESERNATNLDELLAWNVGRKVRLEATTVHSQQSWAVEGKLLSADGQFAVIEGNGMRNAVAKSSINRLVSFEGEFLVYSQKVKQIARVLRIRATGPTDGQIMVTAMQPGMSWVPAYRADITDDKKLKLVARATLFNELGNLDGIQAKLVVGFPNVAYLGVTEPLVSPAGLAQFLRAVGDAGGAPGAPMGGSGGMANQMAARESTGDADFFGSFEPGTSGGEQLEDLFFYTLPNVRLKVGERSYLVLFETEAEYKRVFTLDVPDRSGVYASGQDAWRGGPTVNEPLDVWHTVRFPNTAGVPLTTGVATVVKSGEVLGQDRISYTSRGAEASLRIAKALDIRADALEEEVTRERGFVVRDGRPIYDRVTVRGTVEITNRKETAVTMRVTKSFAGEATEVGQGGEATKTPAGLGQLNPYTRVVWKPEVKKGETMRLTFTYQLLTPSQ
jgi:hypothetical protein